MPTATKIRTVIIPISARKRYRFLIEWACDNTSDALTVQARFYNATQSTSADVTIISETAQVANIWQVNTATIVPPTGARWMRIVISKPATTAKYGIQRIETKEHDSSLERMMRGINLFDDFHGAGTTIGLYPWVKTDIAGGLTVSKTSPGTGTYLQWSESGILTVTTAATANDGGTIGLGFSFGGLPPLGAEFRCKVNLDSTTNRTAWIGLFSSATVIPDAALANTIHGIGFRAHNTGVAANWFGICRKGTAESSVDLGITSGTTWRDLGWVKTSGGVQFLVNGLPVGSAVTSNMITTSQSIGIVMGLVTRTGAAKAMNVDCLGIESSSTRLP